ncbi:MAG: undecaprenyl-phosphate galactose phosphotransferase WbaP [Rectinemataceae bacterium]
MQCEEFIKGYSGKTRFGVVPMSIAFITSDILVVFFSFMTGFLIMNSVSSFAINFKSFINYWYYIPAFSLVFALVQLYPGDDHSHPEELRRFALASMFAHMGIIVSRAILQSTLDAYSMAFALSLVVSIVFFPTGRGTVRRLLMKQPWWGVPVVVFGASDTGRLLVDRLLRHPWLAIRPVAFLDDNPDLEDSYQGIPIIYGTTNGPRLALECGIDRAIVAMPGVNRSVVANIVSDNVRAFKRYTFIPDYFGMTNMWVNVRDFDGIMGLEIDQKLLGTLNQGLKRLLDVVIVILGGIIIIPFFLVIALFIKIDSPGPVFYGHHRLGRNGVPFKAWKFRSMVRNSREVLEELLVRDPEACAEWEGNFKLRDDPRITRMGRFLRKTSLDEFPQIWNVLIGQMSLVGPRPIIEAEIDKYGHNYSLFSSVKPGMSGLWQVSGRSDLDYDERVALDIYYIQSWSIWLDLYILLKTFGVVVVGMGAY